MSIIDGIFLRKPSLEQVTGEEDLAHLFKEYYDRLVYFSIQYVKDECKAQDIAQDAFIVLWQQKDTIIQNRIAIKNFLYSNVKNASLNVLRHERVVENYISFAGGPEPEVASVMETIIHTEVISEIHHALNSLPENYRAISVLGYLEGKKNHEIAQELNMSVNTVKKQKQKALHLLRLKLSSEMMLLFLTLFTQLQHQIIHITIK